MSVWLGFLSDEVKALATENFGLEYRDTTKNSNFRKFRIFRIRIKSRNKVTSSLKPPLQVPTETLRP